MGAGCRMEEAPSRGATVSATPSAIEPTGTRAVDTSHPSASTAFGKEGGYLIRHFISTGIRLYFALMLLVMLLAVAAPGVADARPIEGDVPGNSSPPEEFEWSDCIWGDAPPNYIVASFRAKDNNEYALECQNVRKIYDDHGFNERTIPCIDHVLTAYDYKGRSETDPRNDLFKITGQPVPNAPGNFIDAFVITDRANLRVVTAYVEQKTVELLPAYEIDLWSACAPVSTTA